MNKTHDKWKPILDNMSDKKHLNDFIKNHQLNENLGNVQPNTGQTLSENILPITIQSMAKTLGQDLVAVKPLSAPTGNLFYHGEYTETDSQKAERIRKERQKKLERIFNGQNKL